MKHWLLVFAKPRQDLVAATHLENQGFCVYCPQVQAPPPKAHPGGTRASTSTRLMPLFPNYLFVHVDPLEQSIAPIPSTRGVRCFVKFGTQYARASEELVARIRERCAAVMQGEVPAIALKRGDRVAVRGIAEGEVEAIFSHQCGRQRAMILLDMLGRTSTVAVPLSQISSNSARA